VAVVTKDVLPFAVMVGVPARLVRLQFALEINAALERIAWWDWPREKLAEGLEDFRQLEAEAFCLKCDPGM
jgi:hypothetical protein